MHLKEQFVFLHELIGELEELVQGKKKSTLSATEDYNLQHLSPEDENLLMTQVA